MGLKELYDKYCQADRNCWLAEQDSFGLESGKKADDWYLENKQAQLHFEGLFARGVLVLGGGVALAGVARKSPWLLIGGAGLLEWGRRLNQPVSREKKLWATRFKELHPNAMLFKVTLPVQSDSKELWPELDLGRSHAPLHQR